jgi:anhydro-N-acetylmuramic acid kinase
MRVDEVFVSGGGTHNPVLMRMLRKALDPVPVKYSTEVGLDVDAKEAIAFALMAYETAHSRPSNVPMATGAKRSVVLGKLTQNGQRNAAAASNGTTNGTVGSSLNGAARNGSGTATHKLKSTRVQNVARPAATTKAKAAAR